MTDNFYKRYDQMMNGGIAYFTEHEVFDFLMHMDYFHINTLKIQSCNEKSNEMIKWFTCKVDLETVRLYIKEKRNDTRIVLI